MDYNEAVEYVLENCKGLDLNLIDKVHIIEEMEPKEEAAS